MSPTISRRRFQAMLLAAGASCGLPVCSQNASDVKPGIFSHPGMLHSASDLARMRTAVRSKSEPTYSGFQKLAAHPQSSLSYAGSGAFGEIGRNPNLHFGEFDRDSNAAYQCALMWTITGNLSYASLAMGLVDSWTRKLKAISGADAVLCASLGGFKMANAAELLRHTDCGWNVADAQRFSHLMRDIFLPVIDAFAPFANGNWDTAAIKLMMAMGIYDDDRTLFERAVNYYLHGCGDGRLGHYIYPSGQCQESGRDQQHTQLGIGHMGDACEMAWHQGLDLYGALDHRLLTGFEYTAKYELGESVPFIPDIDQTGKYRHAVISERSALRPVFEQIYNHYVNRVGMAAPWTAKAAAAVRPEGAPFQADATGFGTLLYTREKGSDPDTTDDAFGPTIVYAQNAKHAVELDFVSLVGVKRYEIWRADRADGVFTKIAQAVTDASYRDTSVAAGRLYFYAVSASAGHRSRAVPAMNGLPSGWEQSRVGALTGEAMASFDGSEFRMSSGGAISAERGGPLFAVERSISGATSFAARLSPLVASSSVSVGLILRDAKGETLLSISSHGAEIEHPAWTASLLRRGNQPETLGSQALAAPTVTYGRLRGALWLRFNVERGMLHAATSVDNERWKVLGSAQVPTEGLRIGMFVSSGIEGMSTEVAFDNVSLKDHAQSI